MFVCTADEQMEECDATASPNVESPSENSDSEVDTNYSLSDDSYSDSSDTNSSSLHEVSFVHLMEHNVDLSVEWRKKKPKSRRKGNIQSEW